MQKLCFIYSVWCAMEMGCVAKQVPVSLANPQWHQTWKSSGASVCSKIAVNQKGIQSLGRSSNHHTVQQFIFDHLFYDILEDAEIPLQSHSKWVEWQLGFQFVSNPWSSLLATGCLKSTTVS